MIAAQTWFVILAFGLPLAGVCALSLSMVPRSDAVKAAVLLAWLWAGAVFFRSIPAPPQNMTPLIALDLIGGLAIWLVNRKHPEVWKRALVLTFVASLTVHAAMWVTFWLRPDLNVAGTRNMFTLARNVIFYTQLLCVGWTGAGVATRRFRDFLPRRAPGRHAVGSTS